MLKSLLGAYTLTQNAPLELWRRSTKQNLSDSTSHNYFLVIFFIEKAGHFFKFQSPLSSILTDDRKRF